MASDRFGNAFAPGLPYARGAFIRETEDDLAKLGVAWAHMAARLNAGDDALYNFTGLVRSLPLREADTAFYDDEIAPARFAGRLKELALEHLGGDPERHDVMLLNRLTAGLFAAHIEMVEPGSTVLGVSARLSHPVLPRSARRVGATYVDATGVEEFEANLSACENPSLVVLTRLSVSYELLDVDACRRVIELARERDLPVLIDDAGGARVGPAMFGQPKMLEFAPDVGATGLDKYGTAGPRLGLLAGNRDVVAGIRARAFELGLEARPMLYPAAVRSLEQYDPEIVRSRAAATREVAQALRARIGERVFETPGTAQIPGEEVLAVALERAGLEEPPGVVPYEATAALAMLLLRDHGIVTVHFAGLPPGNGGILLKFLPIETLERFGGADALADAIDASLDRVAEIVQRPDELRALLFGPAGRATARDPVDGADGPFDLDGLIERALSLARKSASISDIESLLADVVADPDLARTMPSFDDTEVILHESPELTVFHISLEPGVHYPPHNHGMAAAIGMYHGRELNVFYAENGAALAEQGRRELSAGETCVMGPSVIHSVANPGETTSRAIHMYLGDLPGVERSLWDPITFERHPFDDERYFAFGRPLEPA